MVSIVIFAFRPEKREEVMTRRLEEADIADGIKIIGEWCSLETGRVFRLLEGKNLKASLVAYRTWNELGKIEVIPVKKSEELLNRSFQ